MALEIWKTIPSVPDYSASSMGRIKSDKSGKILNSPYSMTLRHNERRVSRERSRLSI